jgi:hypothetical protein
MQPKSGKKQKIGIAHARKAGPFPGPLLPFSCSSILSVPFPSLGCLSPRAEFSFAAPELLPFFHQVQA